MNISVDVDVDTLLEDLTQEELRNILTDAAERLLTKDFTKLGLILFLANHLEGLED